MFSNSSGVVWTGVSILVILKLIENNYIITKECYQVINKILYDYKKSKINNVEIVINEENGNSNLDFNSYISYVKNNDHIMENENIKKRKGYGKNG